MTRAALVVGARGLLGKAVVRALAAQGRPAVTARVPWSEPPDAVAALLDAVAGTAHEHGTDWDLLWCAGSAVTGATAEQTDVEVATFTSFVDGLVVEGAARPARMFLASSAGAVYAGVDDAPFTEHTPPRPLAPYGHAKLRLEAQSERLAEAGTDVLVGRISNLYGPGQNLHKEQGLISRLCRAHLMRDPASIYVSLDTIRDYLFVDDCAALLLDGMDVLRAHPPGTGGAPVVKILAAQQSATIGALLGACRQVFGPRIPVTLGTSALAGRQARDLRFRSLVWPELDRRSLTTLPHGIHATAEDLRRLLVEAAP
ncbi:NAD-dependent epimerase/dehydratase family protein [Cellulomonas shaoxiangyii]|uniref:NAD-dependent epimerase/dehydratase family protein n=1 Tax=Cellulomonas shaoxiangyii TaxID=2566013 RepID=A0A4P7SHI0_9CELL|nr:NAD-dependent epimerase/dehydratase family protein [Cellulomonas shaoxiangyii]QCB93128.1 NAD-dependent epimerase/dehydratase family protein [Cellulomonas shaoxiangyii]TGY84787.1 NAD-dependent epimerase/dehydratase family protein [Cellulomonas shaoxiangyii]